MGAVSLFLFFASGWVGPWFIDKKDAQLLIPLVVKYMQMMAPFYLFYAIAEALSGASCGLGETVAPMITTLLSICLFRVCSIWVILPKFETMECIIWIYIASWIVAVCLLSDYSGIRAEENYRKTGNASGKQLKQKM